MQDAGVRLRFNLSCFHLVTWSSVVTVAGICNSVGGGVFFDIPPQCWWRWQISVGVKARVVNRYTDSH